jgi:pimeloyl-ACP methyl ester carboxylesterase
MSRWRLAPAARWASQTRSHRCRRIGRWRRERSSAGAHVSPRVDPADVEDAPAAGCPAGGDPTCGARPSYPLTSAEAKLDAIITRSLGEGERVIREFRPWMRIMGCTKARVGQPFHIPSHRLRMIHAPTLVFLGGRDGLVGNPAASAKRARQNITGCIVEVLPDAGHVMSVDEPEFVGERIIAFLR